MDIPNAVIEAETEIQISSCWCGGRLSESVHPAYSRCVDCGTFVLKKQLTDKQLIDFYTFEGYWHTQALKVKNLPPIEQRVVNDFNDRIPVWFHLLRQLVLRYNPAPNLLLEIGCAHGGFLHYCRRHGLRNVVGNEPDEETCRFAKDHFDLPHVVHGLFPDVSLPFDTFGVVVGFDVVEHFSKPVGALKKVNDLLSKEGFFLFQIPCYRAEGAEWPQFEPPEHIFLYDSQNIKHLFGSAGLEITHVLSGCFPYDMFVIGHKK